MRFLGGAEGEGFEPPRDLTAPCDFRDRSEDANLQGVRSSFASAFASGGGSLRRGEERCQVVRVVEEVAAGSSREPFLTISRHVVSEPLLVAIAGWRVPPSKTPISPRGDRRSDPREQVNGRRDVERSWAPSKTAARPRSASRCEIRDVGVQTRPLLNVLEHC